MERFRAKFKAARHPGSALHPLPFNLPPSLKRAHISEHLRLQNQGRLVAISAESFSPASAIMAR